MRQRSRCLIHALLLEATPVLSSSPHRCLSAVPHRLSAHAAISGRRYPLAQMCAEMPDTLPSGRGETDPEQGQYIVRGANAVAPPVPNRTRANPALRYIVGQREKERREQSIYNYIRYMGRTGRNTEQAWREHDSGIGERTREWMHGVCLVCGSSMLVDVGYVCICSGQIWSQI